MQNFYKAVSACFLATVIAGCGGSSTDNAGTILGTGEQAALNPATGATKSQSDVSTPNPDVTNPQSPHFLAGTRGE